VLIAGAGRPWRAARKVTVSEAHAVDDAPIGRRWHLALLQLVDVYV